LSIGIYRQNWCPRVCARRQEHPQADAPLVVDAEPVLPGRLAGKFLQPVARWYAQIVQAFGRSQDGRFSPSRRLQVCRKFPGKLPGEEAFRLSVG